MALPKNKRKDKVVSNRQLKIALLRIISDQWYKSSEYLGGKITNLKVVTAKKVLDINEHSFQGCCYENVESIIPMDENDSPKNPRQKIVIFTQHDHFYDHTEITPGGWYSYDDLVNYIKKNKIRP